MTYEQYANSAQTTLNGAINNSVTSLTLTSATGFPSSGNFRLLIDSEILLGTAISGTTVTVTRGAEGTTAASHADLATVTCVLTAASTLALPSRFVNQGAFASRPSVGSAGGENGAIYRSNDGWYTSYSDGSAWTSYVGPYKVTEPPTGSWSDLNLAGGETFDTSRGSLVFTTTAATGINTRGKYRSSPGGTYTFTVMFTPLIYANANNCGIFLRESSSGKLVTFRLVQNTNTSPQTYLQVDHQTGPTATINSYGNAYLVVPNFMWFRVVYGATNRDFYWSMDGVQFTDVLSQARNTDFTSAPDQIGFMAEAQHANIPAGLTVHHWLAA